jgi:hypothetical protein
MVATDKVKDLFEDALEMLARGKVRNVALATPHIMLEVDYISFQKRLPRP